VIRNSERAKFEGYFEATEFLCCPECGCIKDDAGGHTHDTNDTSTQMKGSGYGLKEGNDCPPRLKGCEEAICIICNNVKATFCCDADTPVKITAAQNKPEGNQEAE
jgi:hypothetical protein